jgi:ubiquinone/menaquinone biosynthesis C-methylase UbiE
VTFLGSSDRDAVLAREAAFHDALIRRQDPAMAPPEPPDSWERAILEAAGPLAGRRVLDYGCGTGALSLHLSDAGASHVTGLDVSPASVSFARARAAHFRPGAAIEFVTASAERSGLASGAFDVMAGRFVLHHLDVPAAVAELDRLLAPGGRAVFIETSARNPVTILLRAQIVHRGRFGAIRVGTEDERPLGRRDLALLRARFARVRVDYPIFWLFRPFARQVLARPAPELGHRVAGWDSAIARRAPWLGPLSYHMRIVVEKR